MQRPFCLVFFGVLFVFLYKHVEGAKILAITALGTKSHTIGFEPLYQALASRGHQVTHLTNSGSSKSVPNMRYIQNLSPSDLTNAFLTSAFDLRLSGKTLSMFDAEVRHVYEKFCQKTYSVPEVMALLQEEFDLVIINSFANECMYGLASAFKNAKIMHYSTLPLLSWVSSSFGNPVTPSHVPVFDRPYTEVMTFSQRFENFITTIRNYYMFHYHHVPAMEAIYRQYFPDAPSVEEFNKNVDFILINSHPLINYPRALLPNMIETSGLQCGEGKPLPKDIEDFIKGAGEHGFIYFSLGSFLQGSQLPEKYRTSFLKAFAKLKQRVLWKFETETMDDLPPNVKLSKWFPQQDVLAHPSIRLFITHGGLLSIQESVFHGVPLLGVPLFGDQDGNLQLAVSRGFSITLNFENISEKLITEKLEQILGNPSFRVRAKEVSALYRDRPQSPLETAIFWTEYLLRSNDTSHMRSASRDLNVLQYHSIDVIGLLAGLLLLAIYVLFKISKFVFSFITSRVLRTDKQKVKRN